MSKTKLILADEDKDLMEEMKKIFTDEKYEVVATTSNGSELINLINVRIILHQINDL